MLIELVFRNMLSQILESPEEILFQFFFSKKANNRVQRSLRPIGEEHPSTEASQTQEKSPFLRYNASGRLVPFAFPSHFFSKLSLNVALNRQNPCATLGSRTESKKLGSRGSASNQECIKESKYESEIPNKKKKWRRQSREEEKGVESIERERRNQKREVDSVFNLFVPFFMLCFVLSLSKTVCVSLSRSSQRRDVEEKRERRLTNRLLLYFHITKLSLSHHLSFNDHPVTVYCDDINTLPLFP